MMREQAELELEQHNLGGQHLLGVALHVTHKQGCLMS